MRTLTFKDIQAFEKRIQTAPNWNDFFKLNGKMWNIYEYGGGSMFHMSYDYVYFLNKRTGHMIRVEYHCPSYQWVKTGRKVKRKKDAHVGKKWSYNKDGDEFQQVQTQQYKLLEVELEDYKHELWR